MTPREILREQAEVLRKVAESSDVPAIRQELRRLAGVCEEMIQREETERQRMERVAS